MTYVYRTYAKDGRLLYVGCTDAFERRIMQHASSGSLWFHDAESFSLEYHPSRKQALAAEREAIRTEWPLYNIDSSVDPATPRLLAYRRHQRRMRALDHALEHGWPPPPTPEQFKAEFQRSWAEHCRLRNAVRQAELGGSTDFYHFGQQDHQGAS